MDNLEIFLNIYVIEVPVTSRSGKIQPNRLTSVTKEVQEGKAGIHLKQSFFSKLLGAFSSNLFKNPTEVALVRISHHFSNLLYG